jgi:glucose/arabinose dehydrogenase
MIRQRYQTGLFLALLLIPLATFAGQLRRVPNHTLVLPDRLPQTTYGSENLFDTKVFDIVDLAFAPDDPNRLFMVHRWGLIQMVEDLAAPAITTFLDIQPRVERGEVEQGMLGLEFHPNYQENGFFYIFYTAKVETADGLESHMRLSQLQVSDSDPNAALPDSEIILISQKDPFWSHNGGDIAFGPDGYLYLSIGDGGGNYDFTDNSQRIDGGFFGGILRIDVDNHPENLLPNPHSGIATGYRIPKDNPFVGASTFNGIPVNPDTVRTEFYAVGFRNPWRMAFDSVSGELFAIDVGQDTLEEINLIEKGGNYGWAIKEGTNDLPSTLPPLQHLAPLFEKREELQFIDPITQWGHTNGFHSASSILAYRGNKFPDLHGSVLFTEFTSLVGAIRPDGQTPKETEWLFNQPAVAVMKEHPTTGDILMSAIFTESNIKKLVSNPPIGEEPPALLSATGAFTDLSTLQTFPGIVPYEINHPFWSDNALKTRWFSIPDSDHYINVGNHQEWNFPSGMVWIKHFELETIRGNPSSRKRIETRFIVKNDDGVYGITYRWRDDQSEADLVPAEGDEQIIQITEDGIERQQTWSFPSRLACLQCHTQQGGYALGFERDQLDRSIEILGGVVNQTVLLQEMGYFGSHQTELRDESRFSHLEDTTALRGHRVKSYLDSNCSQCHQPGGPVRSRWDARMSTPLRNMNLIEGNVVDTLGILGAKVIKPGAPDRSTMFQRLSNLGPTHMPPLGSRELNKNAIALLQQWIEEDLAEYETFQTWAGRRFDPQTPESSRAEDNDPDNDGVSNWGEYLTNTDPLTSENHFNVMISNDDEGVSIEYDQVPGVGYVVEWTPLAIDTGNDQPWIQLHVDEEFSVYPSTQRRVRIVDRNTSPNDSKLYRVRLLEL